MTDLHHGTPVELTDQQIEPPLVAGIAHNPTSAEPDSFELQHGRDAQITLTAPPAFDLPTYEGGSAGPLQQTPTGTDGGDLESPGAGWTP